jgi:PAS domain S-box-containing protein
MATHNIPENTAPCDNDTPVYSSRIIRVYLDCLQHHYPDINVDEIIRPAGIKQAEVDDPGFWYSQNQANLMHAMMVAKTGDPHISRVAGQYTARSQSLGKIRQLALALVSPLSVYLRTEKLNRLMSRGARLKVKNLEPLKVEITATPIAGIDEAFFQCENRLGTFEGIASLLSNRYADVKHTKCLHRGDSRCEYIVTWKPTLAFTLKKAKRYVVLGGGLLSAALFFFLPHQTWFIALAAIAGLSMAFALSSDHFEKQELSTELENHLRLLKDTQTDSDLMYNNALLVQKLGQVTARIFDLETYLKTVMEVMRTRMGFDRGAILLTDKTDKSVSLAAGFGYTPDEEKLLNSAADHLANPQYERFAITLLKRGKSILVNDFPELEEKIPPRSYTFGTLLKVHSFICVPVMYENQPLGLLLVDNKTRKRKYYQSDVNFIEGIAGQIATSIINSKSFIRLRESEEKFKMVFQTSPDSFAINRYDNGVYVDVNEGYISTTGYSRAELLGKTPADLGIWESGSDRRHVAVEIGRFGFIDSFETRFRLKAGRQITGQLSAKIVMLDQQKHVLSITRDISGIKRMESERKELEAQLRRSAKMESIGTLAGGVAHDFNNLMMGIQGNVDLMALETQPTSDNYSRLKKIEQYIESGAELTGQLIGFAQVGKYDLHTTDLNELVKRTTRMFSRTKKELTVNLEPAATIWTTDIDQGQIEQVLLNLFVNAWQAMPGGGDIFISLRNTILDNEKARLLGTKPGPYVSIAVTDTGVGMDDATREKIFDPFFTTRKMGRGTGLGLAAAYGIVKNHAGTIQVSSKKGAGTTFTIYIPASGTKATRAPERALSIEKGTGIILLVDDEQMIVDVGRQLLEHLGYIVLTAGGGKEAVELVIDNPERIDLVILDLIMPGMDGGEAFDALRAVAPEVKVLLSSGYALEGKAYEMLDRGCNGFIQKPFTLNNLSVKIRAVLKSGT